MGGAEDMHDIDGVDTGDGANDGGGNMCWGRIERS